MVTASIWSSFEDAVRDAIGALEDWFSALSPVDFILVVLIVWALYWLWSSLQSMTRLGAVEVADIGHALPDAHKPDVGALTGLLRERLAKGGLTPPPQVPAGSPQANLIAAVESTGDPQAQWVAKALSLLPTPPRPVDYKLTLTLFFEKPDPPAEKGTFGARYWLQPATDGQAQLETVRGQTSPEEAVCRVAADVVLDISRNAPHTFPQWSLWTTTAAFLDYMNGVYDLLAGKTQHARRHFKAAHTAQPSNLLVELQLANLSEHTAAARSQLWRRERRVSSQSRLVLALEQAKVARNYLDIGVARADLVSARYRAGIAVGRLAGYCAELPDSTSTGPLRRIVGISATDDPTRELYRLAEGELKAAYQLTARFHVLAHERRLRHRYEPTGTERLRLRRTIGVAREALTVTQLRKASGPTADAGARWASLRVRWWHLGVLRLNAGWNAHYNAGCVFALLHERRWAIAEQQREAEGGAGPDPIDSYACRDLRRRAYEFLGTAIDTAGDELQPEWLARDDPALRSLRDVDEPEWQLLVRRVTGNAEPSRLPLPQAVLGEPRRRRFQATLVGLGLLVLALAVLLLFDQDPPSVVVAIVLLAGAVWALIRRRQLTVLARRLDARSVEQRRLALQDAHAAAGEPAQLAPPGRTSPVS